MKAFSLFTLVMGLLLLNTSTARSEDLQKMYNLLEDHVVSSQNGLTKERVDHYIVYFTGLCEEYPDQWLPTYYLACYRVHALVFNMLNLTPEILNAAHESLVNLTRKDNRDESETLTLWAYYYNMLIAANPTENKNKYESHLVNTLDDALRIKPDNPRAICMRLIYEQNLSEMMQPQRDRAAELEKAETLLAAEEAQHAHPRWSDMLISEVKLY